MLVQYATQNGNRHLRRKSKSKKKGASLNRVARCALHNHRRYTGESGSLGLKPGASFVAMGTGETGVVFERDNGGNPVIVATLPRVTYTSRILTGAEYDEALAGVHNGAGNGAGAVKTSSLRDVLAKALDAVGEDAILDALIVATTARHSNLDLSIAAD
jgi:hypothetical protein